MWLVSCTGGSPSRYGPLGDEGFMSLPSTFNSQRGLHTFTPQEGVSVSFIPPSRDAVSVQTIRVFYWTYNVHIN